ncbi:MAG: hypothetical protein KDI92_00185 [Xanthomonadales bacterium]|nr:hypothetical protein [Xanthomonadales bacterium]
MKKYCLMGLMSFMQVAGAVDTCDYQEESSVEYVETEFTDEQLAYFDEMMDENRPISDEERWMMDLNKHLMQHEDVNIAMIALNMLNINADRFDPHNQAPVLDIKQKQALLEKVSFSPQADYNTLMMALSLCDESLSDSCGSERIKDKIFKLAPDNIDIYLSDLSQAVKEDDAEMVELILNRMSQAKYSQMMHPLSAEFKAAVDGYLAEHAYPENLNEAYFEAFGLDDSNIDMEALNRQYLFMSYKMIAMAHYPVLRPLITACESYPKTAKKCLSIAQTLQNNSDSILMTMIGYNLETKVQERMGDQKAVAASEQAAEAFSKYYQCLLVNQTKQDGMSFLTDLELLNMMNDISHEAKGLEQFAVIHYEKLKKAGVENLTDPKSCGLRYSN